MSEPRCPSCKSPHRDNPWPAKTHGCEIVPCRDAWHVRPEPCGCIRNGIDSEYCDEHALKLEPLKITPEAKQRLRGEFRMAEPAAPEAKLEPPPHQQWREADQYGTLRCNVCGKYETELASYGAEPSSQPGEFMSANEFWPIWLKGKGRMLCTKAPSEVSCMFAEAYHRAALDHEKKSSK